MTKLRTIVATGASHPQPQRNRQVITLTKTMARNDWRKGNGTNA